MFDSLKAIGPIYWFVLITQSASIKKVIRSSQLRFPYVAFNTSHLKKCRLERLPLARKGSSPHRTLHPPLTSIFWSTANTSDGSPCPRGQRAAPARAAPAPAAPFPAERLRLPPPAPRSWRAAKQSPLPDAALIPSAPAVQYIPLQVKSREPAVLTLH